MKRQKRKLFWIAGIFAIAIAAAIVSFFITEYVRHKNAAWQQTGDQVFSSVRDFALKFPEDTGEYEFAVFYYCDETTEYLILQNKDRRICGVRPVTQEEATEQTVQNHNFSSETPTEPQDPAVYYMDGKIWQINSEGELTQIGLAESPVEQIAKGIITELMTDESLTYTHERSKGGAMPLWLYFEDSYLHCSRNKYPDCMEVMVCEDGYLQWNIAKDSHHAVIYLYAGVRHTQQEKPPHVRTWGDLEPAVYQALFS